MRGNLWKALLVFLACVIVITALAALLGPGYQPGGGLLTEERIALLHIEGTINSSSGGGGLLSQEMLASSVQICDLLYQARADDSVKAVLLRVDSPGGSAAGSDEIYRAILDVRKSKPVVVSMGDVAASGGYYLASAADYIFANGATLTGSIGVIFPLMNWTDLANKVGIKDQTLTAGQFKDIGSPWRPMSAAERQQMQTLMKQVHEQFIKAVVEGRKQKMTEAQVRAVATGMVFTGEAAAKNGLVDEVGGMHAAEIKVRELAKVGPDVPIEEYGVSSWWDDVFAAKSNLPAAGVLGRYAEEPLAALARQLCLSTALRGVPLQ